MILGKSSFRSHCLSRFRYGYCGTPASGVALLLDGLPATLMAFSTARRLSSDYTDALMRIRRTSDSFEQDITTTSGEVLSTEAIGSFVSSGDAEVASLYDQSGNSRNATQSTITLQPAIVTSGTIRTEGGRPALDLPSGGAYGLAIASFVMNLSRFSLVLVERNTGASDGKTVCFNGSANKGFDYFNNLLTVSKAYAQVNGEVYVANYVNGIPNQAQHRIVVLTPSGVRVNGTLAGAMTPQTDADTTMLYNAIGNDIFRDRDLVATFQELILFDSVLTSGQIETVEADLADFYGVTLA